MNNIQISSQENKMTNVFQSEEFGKIEVIILDSQILFNASDVATSLGILNARDMVSNMNEKQLVLVKNSAVGNADIRKMHNTGENFLTESGIYKAIFKSRKENAEKFQDWVTDEVLPTIRKTGSYSINTPSYQIEDPVKRAEKWIEEQKEKQLLLSQAKENEHKVEFYNQVADSDTAIDMGSVAKVISDRGFKIGRNRLFEILRAKKVLMNNNQAFQKYIDEGWFRTIEQKWNDKEGNINISIKTLVYQKGLEKIIKIIQ